MKKIIWHRKMRRNRFRIPNENLKKMRERSLHRVDRETVGWINSDRDLVDILEYECEAKPSSLWRDRRMSGALAGLNKRQFN